MEIIRRMIGEIETYLSSSMRDPEDRWEQAERQSLIELLTLLKERDLAGAVRAG